MAKKSFPELMRAAEEALKALIVECQEHDADMNFVELRLFLYGNGEVDVRAKIGASLALDFFERKAYATNESSVEDAATSLLHQVAGTEEAPF